MIHINKSISLDTNTIKNYIQKENLDDTILIDIETTGLSRKHHMIYMIGLISFKSDNPVFTQFICKKSEDEYELLYHLSVLLEDTNIIIHYNGKSFDIPFIKARMALYSIHFSFNDIIERDIYLDNKKIKHLLPTNNLKLKTIEKLFGFIRKDTFSGKELISHYNNYIVTQEAQRLTALKLHNEEDLLGLYTTLNSYKIHSLIYSSNLQKCNLHNLSTAAQLYYDIIYSTPFEHTYYCFGWKIVFSKNKITVSVDIKPLTLKYYIKNYKDYYFLPQENKVVHKSLAHFVDQQYREKATKDNCFILKTGSFVPYVPFKDNIKIFQESLNTPFYMLASFDTKEIAMIISKLLSASK